MDWLHMAAESGPYEVVLQGGGEGTGNRLYVDDKLVIDNWNIARALQPHVTLQFFAGPHKIVVEDFQSSPMGGSLRVAIADQRKLVSETAKSLAAKADVVVIAAGYDPDSESEGSDRTFDLPFGQEELIRELSAANRKTVVAITSGGNVDPGGWLDHVPAYIEMWYPGEAGGTALAEILFGARIPQVIFRLRLNAAAKIIRPLRTTIPRAIPSALSTRKACSSDTAATNTMASSRCFRSVMDFPTRRSSMRICRYLQRRARKRGISSPFHLI